MSLTIERLHEVLDYNPDTGVFRWKINMMSGRRHLTVQAKAGSIAGTKDSFGYWMISIDCKRYKSHRLAWMYCYGRMPEHDIDHIDRDTGNNRIKNLREVSRQCNARNSCNRSNNTSGVKGVHWMKHHRQWCARVCVNYTLKHIGLYDDFDDAVCARLAAEQCLGWSGCDSSSPAYKYVKNITTVLKRADPNG